MVTLNAHFDGKTIVPDEPVSLAPNQKLRITIETVAPDNAFTPFTDLSASLMNGDMWDEAEALHIDPLEAVPVDLVRNPGSAAGQIKMSDDFNETPAEFKDHR